MNRNETVKLVQSVLEGEQCQNAEVNIVVVDDKMITELNREYLNHHFTTDVLSFCLSKQNEKKLEGEVYVNVAQAKRQASEYNVAEKNEIGRLVIHGTLHLLGYEDNTPGKKRRMSKKEDFYLGNSGLEYFHA
ncbi:MAG: rRNA maturation RNase YbeY [Ignavibacteriales bacterium]|nr:rRNA maturation RNase YbeY [Ignavibacteriales bacterium]